MTSEKRSPKMAPVAGAQGRLTTQMERRLRRLHDRGSVRLGWSIALSSLPLAWMLDRSDRLVPFVVLFAAFPVCWSGSVLLHELGHAAAAWAAGLEPFAIVGGAGPAIFRRRVRALVVVIRALPGGGMTMLSRPRRSHMKWRLLACYAAGPAVTAALLVFAVRGAHAWRATATAPLPWSDVLVELALVNAFLLVGTIVPGRSASNMGTQRGDFAMIRRLPSLPAERLEWYALSGAAVEVYRLLLLGRYAEAFTEAERLTEVDPGNWWVRSLLASLMLVVGLHEEAETHYDGVLREGVIRQNAVAPGFRAILTNDAAWNLYMLNGPARLERADELSAKAIAVLPGHPSVVGTRGAVLVEKGDIVEGRKLLRRAYTRHRDKASKATNLACLAIAAARSRQPRKARDLIEQARRLDEECDVIPRAERELASRETPTATAREPAQQTP